MAAYTQDDGFHEIQLNGKQLVFLFMAATVVSVVIFLCGVLVGRGVRSERGDLTQSPSPASGEIAPTPSVDVTRVPTPQAGDLAATPPPPVDELSYFNRLEKPTPPVETLARRAAVPEPPPPAAAHVEAPPRAEPTSSAVTKPPASSTAPPAPKESARASDSTLGSGYAVQVAALNVRGEADAMAKRLASKGYSAYVLASASGAPAVFRVRIGTFKTRREADAMAARLQKEEQIKPWVTR